MCNRYRSLTLFSVSTLSVCVCVCFCFQRARVCRIHFFSFFSLVLVSVSSPPSVDLHAICLLCYLWFHEDYVVGILMHRLIMSAKRSKRMFLPIVNHTLTTKIVLAFRLSWFEVIVDLGRSGCGSIEKSTNTYLGFVFHLKYVFLEIVNSYWSRWRGKRNIFSMQGKTNYSNFTLVRASLSLLWFISPSVGGVTCLQVSRRLRRFVVKRF